LKTSFEKLIAIELILFSIAIIGVIILFLGYEIGRYLAVYTIFPGAIMGLVYGLLASAGLIKKHE